YSHTRQLTFSATAQASAGDVGLSYQSSGILRITNGSTGLGSVWGATLSGQLLTLNSSATASNYIRGNLGIGQTSPKTKLEVAGTMSGQSLTISTLKSCALIVTDLNGITS